MKSAVVVGYVRLSKEEKAREMRSARTGKGAPHAGLRAQERAIRTECKRRGWKLLRVEQDIGVSGAVEPDKRPGLGNALASVEAGEATGLVAARLDRLTRSLSGFVRLVERSREKGWEIVVLDLNVDTTTPTGEAMAGMLAVFAQWERRMIGQRITDALAVKRGEGVRLGRPPQLPTDVRRRIRNLRTRGWSYGRIAERLNREGVPRAQDGQRWHAATVRLIAGDYLEDAKVKSPSRG